MSTFVFQTSSFKLGITIWSFKGFFWEIDETLPFIIVYVHHENQWQAE